MKGYSRKKYPLQSNIQIWILLQLILHSDQIPVPTFTHFPQIDDEDPASSSDLSQYQQEDSEFQM